MATYQKWDQSYTNKVTTIRLSYRGVKYNKVCDSQQSVHYSPHCPWNLLLYKSGRNSTLINTNPSHFPHYEKNWTANE